MKNLNISRRDFVKSMGLVGSALILPNWVLGKAGAPNSVVNVAIVGVGGRGGAALKAFFGAPSVCKVVAFCDVDDKRAAGAYNEHPEVPRFKDYRVMLDKMGKDIDAVAIITPDHTHFPIALWAMANGKHVFCEKPLTRTVWEARQLDKYAKKFGVITQMGNQGHSNNEGWRSLKEYVDAGLIGVPQAVYCWTNRPVWAQGNKGKKAVVKGGSDPVPSTLDWNDWLNVAPFEEHRKGIAPFQWRGLRNYGTGALGDMACHFMNVPYFGLDLGFPSKVVCTKAENMDDYTWPSASRIEMTFAPKGKRGEVKLYWYDGGERPDGEIPNVEPGIPRRNEYPDDKNRMFIVGSKDTMTSDHYGSRVQLYPARKQAELKRAGGLPEQTITRSTDPMKPHVEWARAITNNVQPPSNFSVSAPFTEMTLLGMAAVASGVGEELVYNPEKMEFKNNPKATRQLSSLYDYKQEFLPFKI